MDKELIKNNWGKNFEDLLGCPTGRNKGKKVKQRDLAKVLGVSENIITQWKQGRWDIGLTSIYAIVQYIKDNYPESTPMQRLFPDLVNDDFKLMANALIKENNELKIQNEKLNEELKKLTDTNKQLIEEESRIKKEKNLYYDIYLKMRTACHLAPSYIKDKFKDKLPQSIFIPLFYN